MVLVFASVGVQYSVNKKKKSDAQHNKTKTKCKTCVGTRMYTEIAKPEVQTVMATILSQPKELVTLGVLWESHL